MSYGNALGFTEEFQENFYRKQQSIKNVGKQGLGFGSSEWEGTGEFRQLLSPAPAATPSNSGLGYRSFVRGDSAVGE